MIKLLTLSLFLFSVFTACSQDVSSRSYERYKILAERNIYVKDRMPQPELSRVPRPILREASVPVYRRTLTGIVNYGSEYTAFFEDSSRKTYRVGKGDSVLNKVIEEITLDYVEYTENGKSSLVKIGESIVSISASGKENPVNADLSGAGNPPEVAVVAPSGDKQDEQPGGDTLLERMRRRREEELK